MRLIYAGQPLGILLFVLAMCPPTIFAQQKEADELLKRASILEDNKQFDSSIVYCYRALAIDSKSPQAELILGRCFFGKGEYDQAILKYNEALVFKPDFDSAYNGRGNVYKGQHDNGLAIRDYTRAIELNPKYVHAFSNRGDSYVQMNKLDSALIDFNSAISLNSGESFLFKHRGNIYSKKGQNEQALADYNKCIALDPKDSSAYDDIGRIYLNRNSYDTAIDILTKCIMLAPNYALAYADRGYTYQQRGDYDLAIPDFNRFLQSYPKDVNTLNNRGLGYMYKGYYDSALADFTNCLKLDSLDKYALLNILPCLIRENRFADAASYYDVYKRNNVNGYIGHVAWTFYKSYLTAATQDMQHNLLQAALEELQKAEKDYKSYTLVGTEQSYAQAKNRYSDVLALKGYILEKLKLFDDAKVAYSQALVINANQPDVKEGMERLKRTNLATLGNNHTAPSIRLIDPAPFSNLTAISNDNTIEVVGRAKSITAIGQIYINGKPAKLVDDGMFADALKPNKGVNKITITATDQAGNSTDSTFTFTYTVNPTRKEDDSPDIPPFKDTKPVFHAILIAEEHYADPAFPSLKQPIADARKLKHLLETKYSFSSSSIDTLFNCNREQILGQIIQESNTFTNDDNLLIFYSGHGTAKRDLYGNIYGYLVPCDAKHGNEGSYISYSNVSEAVNNTKIKHILFIVDACFSGSATKGIPEDAPRDVRMAYEKMSRKVMSSGNEEPVPDNSVFIHYLLKGLEENDHKYLIAYDLFNILKKPVAQNAGNDPQYAPIRGSGDDTGDFVFIKN